MNFNQVCIRVAVYSTSGKEQSHPKRSVKRSNYWEFKSIAQTPLVTSLPNHEHVLQKDTPKQTDLNRCTHTLYVLLNVERALNESPWVVCKYESLVNHFIKIHLIVLITSHRYVRLD